MRFFGWLTGGLGASGALVAVAAALLLALSAAVAFHGWPDRLVPGGAGATPIEIAVAQPREHDRPTETIPAVPRPTAAELRAVARRSASGSTRRAGGTGPRRGTAKGSPRTTRRTGGTGTPVTRRPATKITAPSAKSPSSGSSTGAATGGIRTPTLTTPSKPTTPSGNPLPPLPPTSQAPQHVGQAVQQATQTVGNAVQNATQGAANVVRPVSPPVADTVDSAGAAVDQAVQQVGQVVGGIVSGLAAPAGGGSDRPGLGLGRPGNRTRP